MPISTRPIRVTAALPACLLALLASLMGTPRLAAASWLDGVNWSPDYGRVQPVALQGRVLLVLMADAADPTAGPIIERFKGKMNDIANQYDIASLLIEVGGTIPIRAPGAESRIAYGMDKGGLLRAFAGSEPEVMLVFGSDGALLHIMHGLEISDTWFSGLMKLDVNTYPLLDANNVRITPKTTEACHWFLRGDLSHCFKVVNNTPDQSYITQALGTGIQNAVGWDLKIIEDEKSTHAQVFRAADRLRELMQVGVPDPKQVRKALDPLKKNAEQMKEQEAWKAFLNYVPGMTGVAKGDAPALQQKMLRPILTKYPDTTGAMMASAILAFSGAAPPPAPAPGH